MNLPGFSWAGAMVQASILLALLGGLPACGSDEASGAEVPAPYRFLFAGPVSYDELDSVRARLPYERIEFETFSTWIWGGERITLQRDGAAAWDDEGKRWTGKADIYHYAALCYAIESQGFEALEARYATRGLFDATELTVRVWRAGEPQPVVVEDYGYEAPLALKTIQLAIRGAAQAIRWERDPAQEPTTPATPALTPALTPVNATEGR